MRFSGHQKAKRPIAWMEIAIAALVCICCYLAGMLTMLIIHQHQLTKIMEAMK